MVSAMLIRMKALRLSAKPFRALARLAADRRAVSAVEFALILPIMIPLYMGTVELSTALSADRKVNAAASTIGDLIAQYQTINATEVNNIFDATEAIMQPFASDDIEIYVAAVDIDKNDTSTQTVAWSRARNTSASAKGANTPIPIPTDIAIAGRQVIVTKVSFFYQSPMSSFVSKITGSDGYNLEHVAMLRPRIGNSVAGP